jgi:hypothetical protein
VRPAHDIGFERATEGKKKQQHRTFPPVADRSRTNRNGKHEKVHVQNPLTNVFAHLFGRKPAAEKVTGKIE